MDAAAKPRRVPRRVSADYLRRAAMYYLERYSAPAEQLRRVLQRKIVASCRHHEQDPAAFAGMRDTVVARCVASGLVDDTRFAEARAASLRRKGQSGRAVAAKLAAKGIARDLAARSAEGGEDVELAAARIAARRKRLGPWRRPDRPFDRQKEIAALARAGFAPALARAVIDGEAEPDGLEA
ncbi:RecX family transcriptional regulator [Bosea sp. TND4EK4]|uniref:regulatory protein RecX n=1 Tax=Bosea sp. TND4EK4 TaxID=1907408 RepID=UPI0009552088|nr:RecX family transcriptional regulator [Bosea sp. TND4EK4]SIQ47566.1 regulatory protein [Bosea sp. TND4EK4]